MKKILLAFDDTHLPSAAFEFVRQLNEISPVLLTGVFLRSVTYSTGITTPFFQGPGVPSFAYEEETFSTTEIQEKISWFESACQKNHIEYRTHEDTDDYIIHQLKKETRFADLLIVGSGGFYEKAAHGEPSAQMKAILHLAECPLLAVPEKFDFPQRIVLAYDGTESSAYAIKQFAYVFPELCDREVLTVYADRDDKAFPDEVLIQELAARHFTDLDFLKLDSEVSGFPGWMKERKNALLVTGSYGRSEVFRKSFVSEIISARSTLVFIAHR